MPRLISADLWPTLRLAVGATTCVIPNVFYVRVIRNSTGSDLARCPHCGKLFRGARCTLSLAEHIANIHAPAEQQLQPSNNLKPFVCVKCKASFDEQDLLDKHLLTHSATAGQVSRPVT